jgi:hypothetical protein
VRALVFVVGLAVGCALRPLSDRYCAEVEEVTGFYDRELQTYLAGVHDGRGPRISDVRPHQSRSYACLTLSGSTIRCR